MPWQLVVQTVPECIEASFQDEQLYYGAEFFVSLKQFTKGIRHHVADKKLIEGDVRMIGKKKMGFDEDLRAFFEGGRG